ncbi:HAD hydrolase-like protein [Vibrio hangzhouensis]|uniref:HAD hydrolase-like protein n=1 Tax=Vibrio hangzhouensis TaxID=462991 RepID=UPI000CDE9193|nr:HAD hydrolase-like protein [Vibrio hangzhouensis]
MVGDNELADIQGAKAIGMATLLVTDQHVVSNVAEYVVMRDNLHDEVLRLTRH